MYVTTQVDVIVRDVALLVAVQRIAVSLVIVPRIVAAVVVQISGIDVIELTARGIRLIPVISTLIAERIEQSVLRLGVCQFVLRRMVQTVSRTKDIVEVSTLVEVEAEVDPRVHVGAHGVDEACLVEAHLRLAGAEHVGSILLAVNAEGDAGHTLAEHADAGGVRTYGRDVGTQGFHRTTHTHVACRTVQVLGSELSVLVGFLRHHGHCAHGGYHCNKQSFHIIIHFQLSILNYQLSPSAEATAA